MPKFADIKPYTQKGSYEITVAIKRIESFLEELAEDYGLNLTPNFQRQRVWTEEQQIRYMEFLLRGGETARVIYFNSPAFGKDSEKGDLDETVLCVDGLQRLTAIRAFLNNEIKVFGHYYKEFEDNLSIDYAVKININGLKNEREVIQWYLDFNSGGTVHSEEELNHVRALLEGLE